MTHDPDTPARSDGPVPSEGVTWHAVQCGPGEMSGMRRLAEEVFGFEPLHTDDGFAMYALPNGGLLELFADDRAPDYGLNPRGAAFGFGTPDLDRACGQLAGAGYELLGDVATLRGGYAFRHFRGPGGRVFGINQDPGAVAAVPPVRSPL